MEDCQVIYFRSQIDIDKVMTELEVFNRYDRTFIRGKYLSGVLDSLKVHERTNFKIFMEELNENVLKFKRSEQEIKEIKESVHTVIDQFLRTLGETNSAFEVSHKYPVGSMAEGTSISEPDEFDFIAVLTHWSRPDALTVQCVVHTSAGMLEPTFVIDRHHASVKFRDVSDTEQRAFVDAHTRTMENNYWGYREYEKNIFNTTFSKCRAHEIETVTGKLLISDKKPEFHGPVYSINVLWKSKTGQPDLIISIDIATALERNGVTKIIQEHEVYDATYFKQLSDNDTYMLIPMRKCLEPNHTCFQLTFTNTEVQLVKNLSNNHKLCNKTLKYICGDRDDGSTLSDILSSYLIKTCVLMHAPSCKTDQDPYSCMVDIICTILYNIICNSSHGGGWNTVSCIFMQKMIVSDRFRNEQECKKLRRFLLCVLNEIVRLGSAKSYSFNDYVTQLDRVILRERSKFVDLGTNREERVFYQGFPKDT